MAQQANQYLNELQELGINFIAHTGDPTGLYPSKKGTIYIKTDATTTTTRLWINTNGGTTWAYVTTSA